MGTLYASDLDGTLLASDGTLSAFSRDGLLELLAEGMAFTVATARSVVSVQAILREVPLALPVVEFNGAFISDLATGRHEIVNALDPAVAADVLDTMRRSGFPPFIASFDGATDRLHYREIVNDGMEFYRRQRIATGDRRLRLADDLGHALREQVVCLTAIGRAEPLADVQQEIRERHADSVVPLLIENQYSPGWYWLTVHDRRATKDQGIRSLAELCGLAEHELVVFGDNLNDLSMFGMATEAIAVANAVPELRDRATRVIGSNEEDGVVRYLRESLRLAVG